MELLFFWFIMAGVVAFVANSKGRSGGLWFLYGFVIWPIALIHAIVIQKDAETIERQHYNEGKMRCPNCADWVYKQAKTCPHCQHRLSYKTQLQPTTLSKTVREHLIIVEDTDDFWKGDRDLDAAQYKIHLSEKYAITKNNLFEKYVCLDEMFDTLDDALAYADKTDREQEAEIQEGRENSSREFENSVRFPNGTPPDFNRLIKTHIIRKGMFSSLDIHEMDSGQFLYHDGDSWLSFDSLEDARKHVSDNGDRSP